MGDVRFRINHLGKEKVMPSYLILYVLIVTQWYNQNAIRLSIRSNMAVCGQDSYVSPLRCRNVVIARSFGCRDFYEITSVDILRSGFRPVGDTLFD